MAGKEVAIKRQATSKVDLNIPLKMSKTDYQLNLEKSLLKKLEAAQRNKHLSYKRTHGGIVGIADTATYELLKAAALKLYTNYPTGKGNANYTRTTDKTGNNEVQITVRVELCNSDSYTVNFYNTTCKMLINGKNVNQFLFNDLESIHKIVSTCKFNGKEVNLKKLNEMFTTQLNQILETLNSKTETDLKTKNDSALQVKTDLKSVDDGDSIRCIGCKKNCRKNAVYCTTGSHWVHYRCEKLNDKQIKEIESDSTQEYCCKLCATNSNHNDSSQNLALPSISYNTEKNCSAQAILEEESEAGETCNVCCVSVDSSNGDACSVCNQLCHKGCMEGTDDDAMCYMCKALNEQDEYTKEITYKNADNNVCIIQDDIEQDNTQTIETDKHCTAQNSELKLSHNTETKENETSSKKDENLQFLTSEMRLKQQRLKKLEQDLKLKEKLIQDSGKDKTRLETRLLQLESQNDELMNTIKTLKRKIAVLEETSNPQQMQAAEIRITKPPRMPENELITSIHEKVTNYILKQVDKQLAKLDDTCEADIDKISQNVTVQPTSLKQPTNSEADINNTAQHKTYQTMSPTQTTNSNAATQTRINDNDKNCTYIYKEAAVPNTHMIQNLSGPPIQYMPVALNNIATARQHYNGFVAQNPTTNSRTPWSTAYKRRLQKEREQRKITKKDIPMQKHTQPTDNPVNKLFENMNLEINEKVNNKNTSIIVIDESDESTNSPFLEISPGKIDLK